MKSRSTRQTMVWGGFLILCGVLLLLEWVTDLSDWVWIAALAAGALVATALYLSDRSDWAMLLTAYVLWAIVILIALVRWDVLRNEAIAFYVLLVIALPFFGVFYRDRRQWWALIPGYVMVVVAVMIGLIGLGVLDDMLVPAYVLFAIALPFFVVYARDRSLWWALIPGGILAVIGLAFLIAEAAFVHIGGLVLVLVGVGLLVRGFTRGRASSGARELPDVEPDEPAMGPEE
ncbi:hypothetical protein ACFLT5_02875 [Chloroflexota bacterium]